MTASHGLHARRKQPTDEEEGVLHTESPESGSPLFKYKKGRRSSDELRWALTVVGGFLSFGLFLGYILLHHQHRQVIVHVLKNPRAHVGGLFSGRAGFRHHFYSGNPRYVTVVMPSVVLPERRTRRLEAIQDTWGPGARAIYVAHNVSEFPQAQAAHAILSETQVPQDRFAYPQLMLVPPEMSFDDGLPRLFYTIRTVHERVNPDFAFFVNDHTFVIPEHLCKYLEDLSADDDLYAGHALKNPNNNEGAFNSGAAGYLLSRATMEKIVERVNAKDSNCFYDEHASQWLQGNPGMVTVQCLYKSLGVKAVDTRAAHKWHRFHAFPLTRMVAGTLDDWYYRMHKDMGAVLGLPDESYDTLLKGEDCCSMDTVSFHYVEYKEARALFATRELLLKNPHVSDWELKDFMRKEWPNTKDELGGYSRELPKENDEEGWTAIMAVLRKMSTRRTQRDC